MFRALGISDEQAKAQFGFLIEAFRYGAPPHGGIALGVDRITMLMARAESLRDVIAFPKTARAQDLLSEAPSEVDTAQLDLLGIAVRRGS
jgi:aspartyl-tRNA synthetase